MLCDILHVEANCFRCSPTFSNESKDKMTLLDQQHHSSVQMKLVDSHLTQSPPTITLDGSRSTGTQSAGQPVISWVIMKRVVYRVHEHMCFHARYSDIGKLLVHAYGQKQWIIIWSKLYQNVHTILILLALSPQRTFRLKLWQENLTIHCALTIST